MQGQGLENTKVGRNNFWALNPFFLHCLKRGQLHVAIDEHAGLALALFHLIVQGEPCAFSGGRDVTRIYFVSFTAEAKPFLKTG